MKRYRIQYQDGTALEVEGALVARGSGVYWVCSAAGQPILQFELDEVDTVEELGAPAPAMPVAAAA